MWGTSPPLTSPFIEGLYPEPQVDRINVYVGNFRSQGVEILLLPGRYQGRSELLDIIIDTHFPSLQSSTVLLTDGERERKKGGGERDGRRREQRRHSPFVLEDKVRPGGHIWTVSSFLDILDGTTVPKPPLPTKYYNVKYEYSGP